MIIRQKILLEFDVPTVSGNIYSCECLSSIVKTITTKEIGGEIINNTVPKYVNTNKFIIRNPYAVVDITDENAILTLLVDVEFFENKLTEQEIDLIMNKEWRLVAIGFGEQDENKVVIDYDIKHVNIEII